MLAYRRQQTTGVDVEDSDADARSLESAVARDGVHSGVELGDEALGG